jgi:hypothetical protein
VISDYVYLLRSLSSQTPENAVGEIVYMGNAPSRMIINLHLYLTK